MVDYPEYWHCIIGPIKRKNLWEGFKHKSFGIDKQMRIPVENAFIDLTGKDANYCYSGWGINEDRKKILNYINSLNKDNIFYQEILKRVKKLEKVINLDIY